MNEFRGQTAEEQKMFKAIQRAMGILDNSIIGTDTMSSIAIKLGAKCFPLALTMYGCPTVIAKNIKPFDPNGGIAKFPYTISGSFTHPTGGAPCSILVDKGLPVHTYSCHAYKGFPESVLYKTQSGRIGVQRVMYLSEIKEPLEWAVGGMGLLDNFDPIAEGFNHGDEGVLRICGHNILGVKNGYLYGVCIPSMGYNYTQLSALNAESKKYYDAYPVNKLCKNKFMFDYAVQLDGGSVFQYNIAQFQRNINQTCGYAIQFI